MTTQQAPDPFTEPEIKELIEKLEAWAAELSAPERHILAELLANAGRRDVNGYDSAFSLGGMSFSPPAGSFGGFHPASPPSASTTGTAGGSSGGTAGRATSLN